MNDDIREPSGGSIFFAAVGVGVLFLLFAGILFFLYLPGHDQQTTAPVFSAAEMKELDALAPAEREARLRDLRWERRVPLPTDRQARLAEIRDQEAAALSNYSWANRETETVRLPIQRAMDLVIQEHRGDRRPAAP